MAVKNADLDGDSKSPDHPISIQVIWESLEKVEQQFTNINHKLLLQLCETNIRSLIRVQLPMYTSHIKEFKSSALLVRDLLERMIKQSGQCKDVYIFCLQTLYKAIIDAPKPSAVAGIIFDIYDDSVVPAAIKLLLVSAQGLDMEDDIKKVIVTLCDWVRSLNWFQNLNKYIFAMLDGLYKLQKFNLLSNISNKAVEQLFLSLIIPLMRPNVAPVLVYLLKLIQSEQTFHRIAKRIPAVFKQIVSTSTAAEARHLHEVVELLRHLLHRYPIHNESQRKEIEFALSNYSDSEDFPKPEFSNSLVTRDPKMPIGLVNMGNTCYMNSVLQALFMTKQLTHDILLTNLPSRIIKSIQQLVSLLLYSTRPELTPREVLDTRPQTFRWGHQQDSFEYLGFILDQLHEDEKRCQNGDKVTAQISTVPMIDDDENWDEEPTANAMEIDTTENVQTAVNDVPQSTPETPVKTMVQRSFGGSLIIKYKCLNCSGSSTNYDHFFDLQLSFPHTNEVNLSPKTNEYTTQSLLDSYFTTEQLVDDDKYYCEKCQMLCNGERNIALQTGPSNLILVIKHFKYDRNSHTRRKLLHKVHHDEMVTVTSVTQDNERLRLTYKLYAVIVHCGMNIDSGHYYTYATDRLGRWFKFNDSFISPSSMNEIKSLSDLNTPYILFYEFATSEKISDDCSSPNDVFTTIKAATLTDTESKNDANDQQYEWPDLTELSPVLQEYVRKDNQSYSHEFRRKNSDDDIFRNYYNKHKKFDKDQDPPSSCGGSMIEPSNRYIY